jgi:hypothetical protein
MHKEANDLATKALDLMEAAAKMTLRMSDEAEVYTYDYLAGILRKCSIYAEDLGDKLAALARLKVKLMLKLQQAQNALEVEKLELEDEAIAELGVKAVTARDRYVRRKLAENPRSGAAVVDGWKLADRVLVEAKTEISRRADIVKRIDSDVRLHQRMIESRMGDGPGRRDPVGVPRTEPVDVVPGLPVEDVG